MRCLHAESIFISWWRQKFFIYNFSCSHFIFSTCSLNLSFQNINKNKHEKLTHSKNPFHTSVHFCIPLSCVQTCFESLTSLLFFNLAHLFIVCCSLLLMLCLLIFFTPLNLCCHKWDRHKVWIGFCCCFMRKMRCWEILLIGKVVEILIILAWVLGF